MRDKDLYGGGGLIESIKHFARRFQASAARVQFVALDPNGTFGNYATQLRSSLMDGKVSVLDLACGSGGGLLGLLCTLAELRSRSHGPPLPLDLCVLGADCSDEGRAIHQCMSTRLRPHMAEVGIRLRSEYMSWDATQPFSTTALMDHWFDICHSCEEYIVFISAFSGFMVGNSDVVLEAIDDIVKRLHDRPSSLAWIEPKGSGSEKMLPKALKGIARLFGVSTKGAQDGPHEIFDYVHPLTGVALPGRAHVLPWENLPR